MFSSINTFVSFNNWGYNSVKYQDKSAIVISNPNVVLHHKSQNHET